MSAARCPVSSRGLAVHPRYGLGSRYAGARNGTVVRIKSSRSRLALVVAAVAVLAVARALPDVGFGLWLRLNAATLVALLPGWAVAQAIGAWGLTAAFVWSLAAIGAALVFVFAAHTSLTVALWILLGVFLLAFPVALWKRHCQSRRLRVLRLAVAAFGVAVGAAIWFVAGVPWGDQLFHIGRVEKLVALGGLSLHRVDEFRDGGLHPGYAFPLWHGFLAVVTRLADVSPAATVLHEPSALLPLTALLAYEAGVAVFRSRTLGCAFTLASVVPIGFAAGHGGALASLAEPGAAAIRLLVPATIALFFRSVRATRPALLITLVASNVALALIHPPYALFLLLGLAGFVLARLLIRIVDARLAVIPLGLSAAAAAAVLLWLRPIAQQSVAFRPTAAERLRELDRYRNELVVTSLHRFAVSPEVFARSGAFAVASLVLLPAAALATPRRWSSFILGAGLPLFALLLFKPLFPHFAALVSLSQARRAASFVPLSYAFTGAAAVLSALLGRFAIAVGLAGGILLELSFPGDFSALFRRGAPGWPVLIGFTGATIAVLIARVSPRPRLKLNRITAVVATIAFMIPIVVHGLLRWTPVLARDPYALTTGLIQTLDQRVPHGSVVFSDINTSYRIAAYAPVYIVAAPPAHVADTKANAPRRRERDVLAFYRTGKLAIPRRYQAQWIVIDRSRFHLRPRLPIVYADRKFTIFKLGAAQTR
jgi:hypothetical protein